MGDQKSSDWHSVHVAEENEDMALNTALNGNIAPIPARRRNRTPTREFISPWQSNPWSFNPGEIAVVNQNRRRSTKPGAMFGEERFRGGEFAPTNSFFKVATVLLLTFSFALFFTIACLLIF